jgi:hypothetical protein
MNPRKGEDKASFVQRCVKEHMNKGGRSQRQCVALCYSMWENKSKGELSDATASDDGQPTHQTV